MNQTFVPFLQFGGLLVQTKHFIKIFTESTRSCECPEARYEGINGFVGALSRLSEKMSFDRYVFARVETLIQFFVCCFVVFARIRQRFEDFVYTCVG